MEKSKYSKLKQIRSALMLNQKEFAFKLGVKQSYYSGVENAQRLITTKLTKKLFDDFNVNPNWFFKDEGVMFTEKAKQHDCPTPPIKGYNQRIKDTLSSLAILERTAESMRFSLLNWGLDGETINRAIEIYEEPALAGKDIEINVSIDSQQRYIIYKTDQYTTS
jgi:transcriptional regulator with XRE-family HTH domain